MDEILQKLINTDLLSESTKTQISEQWKEASAAYAKQLREEVETEVRSELAQTWTEEREQLIAKLDDFLSEALEQEVGELRQDVERFRDHEVASAAKIVEMRNAMAQTLSEEMEELIDKVDAFLTQRLSEEFDELREDIEIARANDLGSKIFESYRQTYENHFVDSDSIQSKLTRTEQRLRESRKEINDLKNSQKQNLREAKLQAVLRPLTGSARDQMALILKNVPTEQLQESYNRFIGRVLREDTPARKPLTESAASGKTTLKTGGAEVDKQPSQLDESLLKLQRLAGIIK